MLNKLKLLLLLPAFLTLPACTAAINPDQEYDCAGATQYCGDYDWTGCGTYDDAQASVTTFCDEAAAAGCGGCNATCDPTGVSCTPREEGGSSTMIEDSAANVSVSVSK